MLIKKATIEDINTLIGLRLDYLVMDKGYLSPGDEDAIGKQLQTYFPEQIRSGHFMAMVAWQDEKPISAAFLLIQERPANPSFITGLTGTLVNVITYPDYRKKGVATKVITALIDEAKSMGISSIDLYATQDGKGVYHKLGFKEPPYAAMRLTL